MIVPIADRLHKVNLQIVTMGVPAQEGITRDNVTVKVDAVVYFRVVDPVRADRQCRGLSVCCLPGSSDVIAPDHRQERSG